MYNLYSMYDRKAKQFSMPVAQNNDETAKRWFAYVVSNSDMVAKDLELFLIGQFDGEFGKLRLFNDEEIIQGQTSFVCSADELIKEIENNGKKKKN